MRIEPPELSIAVYSERDEVETFAHLHAAALSADCSVSGPLEVVLRDLEFELVSDLGDAKHLVDVDEPQRLQLVTGGDQDVRVLREGFVHKRHGTVLAEYMLRIGRGRHPLALNLAAAALGVPEWLWTVRERKRAFELADWSRGALRLVVEACDALYGAVAVERTLPTPESLASRDATLPTELYVSGRLLSRSPGLDKGLRSAYADGDVFDWGTGAFFSGWAPFNSRRVSLKDPNTQRATAALLARAVR